MINAQDIMSRNCLIILAIAVLMATTSCSKKIAEPVIEINNNASTNNGVSESAKPISTYFQPDWTSFKSGGNAKIEAGGKPLSSSMQMRMQRGKSIYVSLRPVMGIEVAKMVISDDSILLVDKLHKRYMHEKASLLTNGVPVTIENLQDIFLGRAFELGKGSLNQDLKDDFSVETADGGKVILKPREQFKGFDYNFVYDKKNNIISLDVTPTKQGASTYSVTYGDVKGTIAGKVAGSLKVSTTMGGKAFTLAIDYNDMKWNEEFTVDTKAPGSKYTRVRGNDIMQLLSGVKK